MNSITAKEEIIATIIATYELYKKNGAVYAPELKIHMKELLESNPKEFISIFKDMDDSRELIELLEEEYIDKILSSMCSRRDMDTLRSFVDTFNLHISKSTKTSIAEAKEVVDKAITFLKEERAKRNEKQIINYYYDTSSGFSGFFNEGGKLNLLVFFNITPGSNVNTVELKDVL